MFSQDLEYKLMNCLWNSSYNQPKQADNFQEIGPEKCLANFRLVNLTNPYLVNMTEPKETRWYYPLEDMKNIGFLIFPMSIYMHPSQLWVLECEMNW